MDLQDVMAYLEQLRKKNRQLQEENKGLQSTLSDIQVVAIKPLQTEVNRLRSDLDVTRGFSGIDQINQLRTENRQLQKRVKALLRELDEKNEKIDELEEVMCAQEENFNAYVLAFDSYQKEKRYKRQRDVLYNCWLEAWKNSDDLTEVIKEMSQEENATSRK